MQRKFYSNFLFCPGISQLERVLYEKLSLSSLLSLKPSPSQAFSLRLLSSEEVGAQGDSRWTVSAPKPMFSICLVRVKPVN